MPKNTHGTRSDLIHCDNCDEDYSATYKRCPFCGARPDKSAYTQVTSRFVPVDRPSSDRRAPQSDDEYVFDGSGVFDDDERDGDERDDGGGAARRGGKRLADDGFIFTPTTIAGIIFSLVVIIAAILIVVKVVLPMVRQGDQPVQTNSPNTSLPNTSQSPAPSTPAPSATGDPTPSTSPSPTVEVSPSPSPSDPVPDGQPTSFTLTYNGKVKEEITISDQWPAPVPLTAAFYPSGTTSTVTWSSSNTNVATVSSKGVITGVAKGNATITATLANGLTQTCTVRVTLSGSAASASPSPSTSTSTSPSPSPSSSSSGTLTLNKTDITISNDWPDPIRLQVSGASGDVTWSSSNTDVATVDANGKVTRVGKGQCRVTATDANGQTASCIVRCGSMGS